MASFISVQPNTSIIFPSGYYAENALLNTFSIIHPNREYMPSYRNFKSKTPDLRQKRWDGILRYYRKLKDGYFSIATGHLPLLIEALDKIKEAYEIKNDYLWNESEPLLHQIQLRGIELRQDQIDAINTCVKLSRGIIQAETGAGKTEIMLGLIKWYCHIFRKDVLILTNRKAVKEGSTGLEGRITDRLDNIEKVINVGSGIHLIDYYNNTIAVCMVQSLANLLSSDDPYAGNFKNWMGEVGLVFCDEIHQRELGKRKGAHRIKDDIQNKSIDFFQFIKTYNRFGMSATPFDFDGTRENVIHKMDVLKNFGVVIELDYELPIKVIMNISKVDYDRKSVDYEDSKEQLSENEDRFRELVKVLYTLRNGRKYPLIFCKYKEEGNTLAQRLSQHFRTKFIDSSASQKQREKAVDNLLSRNLDCLIVSGIFYYGINIPAIDSIVLWHIEKSYLNVIQAIGRGTRKTENKTELLCFDFFDQDRAYLEDHSKLRLIYYRKKGYEVHLK